MAFQKNIRGLQDIHTLSGKVNQVFQPYRAYMKISCLEMEKARLGKEREKAIYRVKNIEKRFSEIENEKKSVLEEINEINNGNNSNNVEVDKLKSNPRTRRAGVRIRY
jgi:predicted nuclease with TOPRIM domain